MLPLLHNADDFELQNALHLAQLSAWAYREDENTLYDDLQKLGYEHFNFLHEGNNRGYDTNVFVTANTNAFLIVFRGTEENSIEDWLNNVDNRSFTYGIGNVRQGFWEASQAVWEQLLEQIRFHYKPTQKLWLAGHSQGGALAQLTARRLFDEKFSIQGVYTYGQPKIGDLLFASSYDNVLRSQTFRIYTEEDSVVKNPPNLYHSGIGVKLKADGLLEIEYFGNIFETAENTFTTIMDMLWDYSTDSLQAHSIQTYLERLSKNVRI
ncbi:lipase family protein [Raineya orbicola]|uniref:Lipase (Class 3) n=1 Tax=Raineya orbicola TaxID=2016530 RepID=A0A2N3I7B9_9BACT|nr:lipase family protein [Raineya orbicola]PKQ66197.1 Lipase (class 3) [Raineya orbicola]